MVEQQNQQPNGQPGWMPTASTVGGSALGIAFSQLTLSILHQFHITLEAESAVSLAVIYTALFGYFFPDGGRRQTKQ